MPTFVPDAPSEISDREIANDGFFPAISLNSFRAAMGLGTDIDPDRMFHELRCAVAETNAILSAWRTGLTEHQTLAEIPAASIDGPDGETLLVQHYRSAVYCRTRAALIEAKRDYDTTSEGHDRADALVDTIDDYMRRSAEAVARLMGRPRSTVELI